MVWGSGDCEGVMECGSVCCVWSGGEYGVYGVEECMVWEKSVWCGGVYGVGECMK